MTEVERLLDIAHGYDKKARYYRKQAGQALIVARQRGNTQHYGSLDKRTTELLVNLAIGRDSL